MKFKLVALALLLFSQGFSFAFSDFVPLKERAQAHSLTGALQGNESVYSNPAASAFQETYSVDGTFAFPKSFSASVVDTRTNSIGGGLGYFKEHDLASSDYIHGLRLTLGSRISNTLALAVAGKALWGNKPEMGNGFKDVDTGLLWNLGIASAGVVVRNFMGGNETFQQQREISLGGRIGYSNTFYVSASAHSKFGRFAPYEYGFGAEYISPWFFSLMGGYRFQTDKPLKPSYWSAGMSFLSPRLSLHYAVEFPQLQSEDSSHLLGITMMF